MRPTSFSQNNIFDLYPRQWFLQYIKKIPSVQDFCYANAGSTIHTCLQKHYEGNNSLEELKVIFNKLWVDSYKLDKSKIAGKKDSYWLMVIEGINKKLDVTSCELKLFWPDVVGQLDVVDTGNHTIADWKSSTRSAINEEDYIAELEADLNLSPEEISLQKQEAKYNGTEYLDWLILLQEEEEEDEVAIN